MHVSVVLQNIQIFGHLLIGFIAHSVDQTSLCVGLASQCPPDAVVAVEVGVEVDLEVEVEVEIESDVVISSSSSSSSSK